MYGVIITIHVIASIFLILVILLQAGRGGGLADSFGGSQMQSMFGTKSANVLSKLTAICAVAFIVTCLTLAIISSRRSKSVVDKVNIPAPVSVPQQTTTVDVSVAEPEAEATTITPDQTQEEAE
ncbi:MAG: preprotein translocase subunit SecG [Candidatus Gorgyraea atricola]|nr:preprotein translocase subunit SecG [Candidatus Gorgyraea atricola]